MQKTLNLKRRPRATKLLGSHLSVDHHPQPLKGLGLVLGSFLIYDAPFPTYWLGKIFLTMENPIGKLWIPPAPKRLTRYQISLQILKPRVDFLLVSHIVTICLSRTVSSLRTHNNFVTHTIDNRQNYRIGQTPCRSQRRLKKAT